MEGVRIRMGSGEILAVGKRKGARGRKWGWEKGHGSMEERRDGWGKEKGSRGSVEGGCIKLIEKP